MSAHLESVIRQLEAFRSTIDTPFEEVNSAALNETLQPLFFHREGFPTMSSLGWLPAINRYTFGRGGAIESSFDIDSLLWHLRTNPEWFSYGEPALPQPPGIDIQGDVEAGFTPTPAVEEPQWFKDAYWPTPTQAPSEYLFDIDWQGMLLPPGGAAEKERQQKLFTLFFILKILGWL